MTLRYYASIVTGVLAAIAATALLWFYTKLPVQEIAFLATFAYWAGQLAVLMITERRDKHDRSKRRAHRGR